MTRLRPPVPQSVVDVRQAGHTNVAIRRLRQRARSLTSRGHGRGLLSVAGDCGGRQNWRFYRAD